MQNFEYKVVPAPKKGLKGKGIKTAEARFANAMMSVMNELGAEGWEYQRSDTLPCEERSGLRGRNTTFQNMLVFRRAIAAAADWVAPATPVDAVETVAAPVAQQAAPQAGAPLVQPVQNTPSNAAPALGSATDAVEVKDPRLMSIPQ